MKRKMHSFNLDSALIAHVQLLKAHMTHKNFLISQINEAHIKMSYLTLSHHAKISREITQISMSSAKKRREIKDSIGLLSYINSNSRLTMTLTSPDLISNDSAFSERKELDFSLFGSQIDRDVYKLETVRQKYKQLHTKLGALREKYCNHNQEIMKYNADLEAANKVEKEVRTIEDNINLLSKTNKELSLNLMHNYKLKSTNINRAKLFCKLPQNKLMLRSKILLKDELKSIIEKSHQDIESYVKSLCREKTLLNDLEKRVKIHRRHPIKSLDLKDPASKFLQLNLTHLSPRNNISTCTSMDLKLSDLPLASHKSMDLSEIRTRLNSDIDLKLMNLTPIAKNCSRTPMHLEVPKLSQRFNSNSMTPLSLSTPLLSPRFMSDNDTMTLNTSKNLRIKKKSSASMEFKRTSASPQGNNDEITHMNIQLIKPNENQSLNSRYSKQTRLSLDITDSSTDCSKIFIFDELYSCKQLLIEQSSTVKHNLSRILDDLD